MASIAPSPEVYQAISAVTAGLAKEGIGKTRKSEGPGANFKFRGIDEVMNALAGLLVEAKLVMLPRVIARDSEVRQSSAGKPIFVSFVDVEFDLVSVEDGSTHTVRTMGEAMDSSDKSTNKAMSAAYKYAALQAFCIPTEGMDDADATTHELADMGNGNRRELPPTQPAARPAPQARGAEPPPPEGWSNWGDWTDAFLNMISHAESQEALDKLLGHPDNRRDAALTKQVDPAMHQTIGEAVKARRDPSAVLPLDDEVPF